MRPINYMQAGTKLGHYAVSQVSGAIAATLAAASPIASFRWTSTERYAVLMRIKAGLSIISAVTTSVIFDLSATIARGFSVDFTDGTSANMKAKAKTGAMRSDTMNSSILGTSGPQIATTALLTGQTYTLDADYFAAMPFPNPSPTLGASAVTNQVGQATTMQTLYEWTSPGQHPVLLSQNEGVILRNITAGPGSGTYKYYVTWEWAEVFAF